MGVTWTWDDGRDIGHGVQITEQRDDQTGELLGILERHECQGIVSGGAVPFSDRALSAPGSHIWTVEQEDPLTISPSVQCPKCPHHGFIRDGQWVPA